MAAVESVAAEATFGVLALLASHGLSGCEFESIACDDLPIEPRECDPTLQNIVAFGGGCKWSSSTIFYKIFDQYWAY